MSVAIAGLKAATSEERAEFLSLLGPAAAKPAKATKAKVVKTPMPLPEGMPSAADYRMTASSIDDSVCVGRAIGEEDKRWRPFVFRETQCGEKLAEGSDLCKKCTARAAKYAAEPKPGPWTGRVTEDPLDWVHMLGTVWAEEKKPKFTPGPTGQASTELAASAATKFTAAKAPASASASATASLAEEEFAFPAGPEPEAPASASAVVSTPEPAFASSSSSAVAAPVVDKAAAKVAAAAAAAAAKAAAKEAEKAAKAAAKEAEKAAIKAVKDKAKLDAAAAVAAAKEKAKAAKPAAKPSAAKPAAAVKVTAPATASAAASDSAAAASDVTPISVEGELKLIDGSLYMVKNGNVYEYDELTEKAGDFVGRITAEETIDTEGAEVGAAESDTD